MASGRWTEKRKKEILESRKVTTKLLCESISACKEPPPVLVGASAVGIYGNRGDELLTESRQRGEGFLADVCALWENSYSSFNGRLVILRTGVVLGHGGALEKLLPPFRLGLGGRLGEGKQWMSWIHLDDLVKMYLFSLENSSVSGSLNAVAPHANTNKEFTKSLSSSLGVIAPFPVPTLAVKTLFGEMSSVLLESQRVSAEKVLSLNFSFSYPRLEEALASLLIPEGKRGTHVFSAYLWVPEQKSKVFEFFCKAENLETITPPWLNFHITKKSEEKLREGTLIDYKLKIKGVPASWRTLISRWSPPDFFTDSQLKGPYTFWDHTHRFTEVAGGTLMTDEVIYKVPLGPVGHVMKVILIENDVKTIFKFRNKVISKLFQ